MIECLLGGIEWGPDLVDLLLFNQEWSMWGEVGSRKALKKMGWRFLDEEHTLFFYLFLCLCGVKTEDTVTLQMFLLVRTLQHSKDHARGCVCFG